MCALQVMCNACSKKFRVCDEVGDLPFSNCPVCRSPMERPFVMITTIVEAVLARGLVFDA